MFYLFILESIGTSELILIGLVALIVFGPRKLPQMARTIGKTMAEFRRSTNEFKETWEREVSFNDEKNTSETHLNSLLENPVPNENSIGRNENTSENKIISPEIKEIDQEVLAQKFPKHEIQNINQPKIENTSANKRDWL